MQFNLSCNIAAKGVVKRCCAFYYTLVQSCYRLGLVLSAGIVIRNSQLVWIRPAGILNRMGHHGNYWLDLPVIVFPLYNQFFMYIEISWLGVQANDTANKHIHWRNAWFLLYFNHLLSVCNYLTTWLINAGTILLLVALNDKWTNERTNKRMNEWKNDWTNE